MKSARDIGLLLALLGIVILAAFVPYQINNNAINSEKISLRAEHRAVEAQQKALRSERHVLNSQRKNAIYNCKLNSILRSFVTTATNTRQLLSNQSTFPPTIKRINGQTASAYRKINRRLRELPPFDCKLLLQRKAG